MNGPAFLHEIASSDIADKTTREALLALAGRSGSLLAALVCTGTEGESGCR